MSMIFLSGISLTDGKEICVSRNNLSYTNGVSSAWGKFRLHLQTHWRLFSGLTTYQEANLILETRYGLLSTARLSSNHKNTLLCLA